MKALGILILLALAGYVGYEYAYPQLADALGIKKPQVQQGPSEIVIVDTPKPPPITDVVAPPPMAPPPAPKVESPAPVVPKATGGLGEVAKKADADGFIAPEIPPVEEVTQNWTKIPPTAFNVPKQVTIMKPVDFSIIVNGNKVGGSQMPAGSKVWAVGVDGQSLTLTPSQGSSARGSALFDETDAKAVLTAVYEIYKVQRVAMVKQAWLRNKQGMQENNALKTPDGRPIAMRSNDKPAKNSDGGYAVLLESMKNGQVTEVTTANIKRVSDPFQKESDGQMYWVIEVFYTTKTMFGDFDTYAEAYILNSRVAKWLYRDSGEVVP